MRPRPNPANPAGLALAPLGRSGRSIEIPVVFKRRCIHSYFLGASPNWGRDDEGEDGRSVWSPPVLVTGGGEPPVLVTGGGERPVLVTGGGEGPVRFDGGWSEQWRGGIVEGDGAGEDLRQEQEAEAQGGGGGGGEA